MQTEPTKKPRKSYSRIESRHSSLTGAQLQGILLRFRIPVTRFAEHAGIAERTAQKYVWGEGDIPLWVEWMLKVYDEHPELRTLDRDLTLPVTHWLSTPLPPTTQRRRGRPTRVKVADQNVTA